MVERSLLDSLLLGELHKHLFPKYHSLLFERKNGRFRLNYRLTSKDSIIVDRSSEVSDGIRVGYVIDLDVTHSIRRQNCKDFLLNRMGEVEKVLVCHLMQRERLGHTAATGQTQWCKIGEHHRMGIHVMVRNPALDWTDPGTVGLRLAQDVSLVMDRLLSLRALLPESITKV